MCIKINVAELILISANIFTVDFVTSDLTSFDVPDFRHSKEKFFLEFQVCLYILYIFTSPSAENKEKFVHLGRLLLPSRPVGYSLS